MALEALHAACDDSWGAGLAAERTALRAAGAGLSVKVLTAFGGYADRQAVRLRRRLARDLPVVSTGAMHLVRILLVLDRLVATGRLDFVAVEMERAVLFEVKGGGRDWAFMVSQCDALRAIFAAG